MGLSISVAYPPDEPEALAAQVAEINAVLGRAGLPPHVEPSGSEYFGAGAPYGYLHHLRRAYAHLAANGRLPATFLEDPITDPVLIAAQQGRRRLFGRAEPPLASHLLQHSDAEGYYVPLDFPEVLMDEHLTGYWLGSVPRLQAELLAVAPHLGLAVEEPGGPVTAPSRAEAEAACEAEDDETDPFWRAREIWLALYDATRHSLATGALMSFG